MLIEKKIIDLTVLMPVYNNEKYVSFAIKSILNQTLKNFEFIIIDDCSSDQSFNIIKSFDDARLKIIRNKSNLGVAESLNKGIKLSKGKYIARMDSDDISLPNRLEYQLNFLKKNPDIGVLGSDVIIINENIKSISEVQFNFNKKKKFKNFFLQNPKTHDCCLWFLLFDNCFYHPTTMFKKSLIDIAGYYDHSGSEDFDLWTRLINKTRFSNLKIPLLLYRQHSNQISKKKNTIEYNKRIVARSRAFYEILKYRISDDNLYNLSLRQSKNELKYKNFVINFNKIYLQFNKKFNLSFFEKLRICIDYFRFLFQILKKISFFKKIYILIKALSVHIQLLINIFFILFKK